MFQHVFFLSRDPLIFNVWDKFYPYLKSGMTVASVGYFFQPKQNCWDRGHCVLGWTGKPPVDLHLDVAKGDKLIQKLMIDDKKCYLFGLNSQMNDFCIDHLNKIVCTEDIVAGKPPVGLHLDVAKGDKLIQKLMIDDKKCYLFGRNSQMNDFCIDHASCSRVHAVLVWHKHLNRAFLVDLGSTHGTYIGTMRLEGNKPTQLPIDSNFHFGASTRMYTIRERPQTGMRPIIDEIEKSGEEAEGTLLGLPETETELDNLTEFNTAHNRRISMLGITDDAEKRSKNRKRKRSQVSFNEDEEIINPEDIDPSIGRFRNLIQTTVVPTSNKRLKLGDSLGVNNTNNLEFKVSKVLHHPPDLYDDLPSESQNSNIGNMNIYSSLSSRLGMVLPNPAPEVEMTPTNPTPFIPQQVQVADSMEPKKKKYAKEAWPGKKPVQTLLV